MLVSKFQVPGSNGLGVKVFQDLEEKDRLINQSVNEWVTEVFVEQPRLNRVC